MDWKTTLDEILAERRQRLGEPPTIDDWVALRAGEVSEEERLRLLEHAAIDPEAARELFEVLRFPDSVDDEPNREEVSVGERWQALRHRLVAGGELETPHHLTLGSQRPPRRRPWLPLAAVFLLGIATPLLWARFTAPHGPSRMPDARVNLPILELLPSDGAGARTRDQAQPATVGSEADGLVLTLAVPGLDRPRDRAPYSLRLHHPDGATTLIEGLVPGVGGVFVLDLPREAIGEGRVTLHLADRDGEPVAQYDLYVALEVELEAEPAR